MSTAPTNQGNSAQRMIIGVIAGVILLGLGLTVAKDIAPPLLQGIDFNLGKTIVQMGVVLILFPLLYNIFGKPLKAAIDERNEGLERTFTEAEQLRSEMVALRSEYDARLAATEADAREQIQAQIREAQNLRQTLMAEASAKADELVSRAQQEIESEKSKVIVELRTSVVDLSLAAAEKVVGENMDNERNRRLVQEFIERVEVAK